MEQGSLDVGICSTCNGTGHLPGINYGGLPLACPDCTEDE